MSTSPSFTWSDTTSISMAPSTFQYDTSGASRSIDDETRTVQSETFSMGVGNPSSFSATGPIYEDRSTTVESAVSSIPVGVALFISALCLPNSNEFNDYIIPACATMHLLSVVLKICSHHMCRFFLTRRTKVIMSEMSHLVLINTGCNKIIAPCTLYTKNGIFYFCNRSNRLIYMYVR